MIKYGIDIGDKCGEKSAIARFEIDGKGGVDITNLWIFEEAEEVPEEVWEDLKKHVPRKYLPKDIK